MAGLEMLASLQEEPDRVEAVFYARVEKITVLNSREHKTLSQ